MNFWKYNHPFIDQINARSIFLSTYPMGRDLKRPSRLGGDAPEGCFHLSTYPPPAIPFPETGPKGTTARTPEDPESSSKTDCVSDF